MKKERKENREIKKKKMFSVLKKGCSFVEEHGICVRDLKSRINATTLLAI